MKLFKIFENENHLIKYPEEISNQILNLPFFT